MRNTSLVLWMISAFQSNSRQGSGSGHTTQRGVSQMNKDKETPADYVFAQGTDQTRRLKRQAAFLSRLSTTLKAIGG